MHCIKGIIIVNIIFLFLLSCSSVSQVKPLTIPKEQIKNAKLLANISLKKFKHESKTNSNKAYSGIGIGKIKNSVEEARKKAVLNALSNIAQSFKVHISTETTVETFSSKNGGKENIKEVLTDKINTTSLANFRDIQPKVCYDEINNQFLALIKIEKNKLDHWIKKQDKEAIQQAQYNYRIAITNIRENNLSEALRNYYNAFYLASQIQNGTVEYYDRKFKKMDNILIESRQRINELLQSIVISDKKIENNGLVYCRVTIRKQNSSPMSFMPFVINKQNMISNREGMLKFKQDNAQNQVEIKLNFYNLRKDVSKEFYGFIDKKFSDSSFDKFNGWVISTKKKIVRFQFYCEEIPALNSSHFHNYNDSNIQLLFSDSEPSPRHIHEILQYPANFKKETKQATVFGKLEIHQQNISGRILIVGEFDGIYMPGDNDFQFINFKGVKIIGYSQSGVVDKFKKQIMLRFIEKFN